MASGGQVKQRGSEDPGEPDITLGDDPTDAGQIILKAANDAAKGSAGELVSIRVEDEAGYGTYCQAIVGGWRREWGGNDAVQQRMFKLVIIQGTIVEYTP